MPRRRWNHCGIGLLFMLGVAVSAVGCNQITLISIASATLGFATGRVTAPTTVETLCFRNGVPIDCGDIPAFE